MKRMLFKVSKSRVGYVIIGFVFEYFYWLLPVKKVLETKKVVAFEHPKPSYNNHILIVPKKRIRDHIELAKKRNIGYATDIYEVFREIVKNNIANNIVLCTNYGTRQDVMQVHFHVYSVDEPIVKNENTSENILSFDMALNKLVEILPNIIDEKGLKNSGYSLVHETAYENEKKFNMMVYKQRFE